ncbi:MAG: polysaccharide biosynthesis tyrosine autokinase, partial [Acidimicrobiales bacterium]
ANLTDLELRAELSAVGEARFVQVAVPPESSSNPPLSRNLALGTVVGLIVGFGLALLAETRDQTIKSAADIEAVIDLPVLASIPLATKKQLPELSIATHRDPEGVFADGYHKVRSALEFASFDKTINSILVTSPSPAEGKSTTSSNLALAMSSVGNRTVLIDVDFRRPNIHNFYKVAQSPGLSDVTLYGAEMRSVAYSIQEPGLQNLLIMPTGTVPPSPAAFVGAAGFLGTLKRIEAEADIVVMDAPPLLAVSDAHTLSRHVDAVLLTARAGQTTKGELAEVVKVLSQVGANVIGVVLIGVEEADTYGKQYYRSDTRPAAIPSGATGDLWAENIPTGTIHLDREPEPPSVLQGRPRQIPQRLAP